MSLVTLVDIRNYVVDYLKEKIKSKGLTIEAHPGNFDEAEIRRLATKTPAVLTSLLKVKGAETVKPELQFVTWIMSRADSKDKLYDNALRLVSIVTPVIREIDAVWCINGASDVGAENLYMGTLDKLNITLWALAWKLSIRSSVFDGSEGGVLLPDYLENFEGYDAEHRIGGQTASDIITF